MMAWIEAFFLMAAAIGTAVSILTIWTCIKAIAKREWL